MAIVDLKRAATMLRNAAPEEFEYFRQHFNAYANETLLQVMEAPSEAVLNTQGRAQQLVSLNRMLAECCQDVRKPAPQ